MAKISATMVADSKSPHGHRISTMQVTFPRFILAELNTHRMLSRNSASSRAIPFEKMVKSVQENPFVPMAWMKDHKGMQGTEYVTNIGEVEDYWLQARDEAVRYASGLNEAGVTKQLCNRLLEPFMWHTVLITATEFSNFFALRCPQYVLTDFPNAIYRSKKDVIAAYDQLMGNDVVLEEDLNWLFLNKGQAEIHMMALAEAMWDCMNESTPKALAAGEWHIPFGDMLGIKYEYPNSLKEEAWRMEMVKICTARCARISYTLVGEEGKPANYENDIKLHDRLAESGHWSPFEHCSKTMTEQEYESHISGKVEFGTELEEGGWDIVEPDAMYKGWSGNFRGFIQYRKQFAKENITA